MELNPQMIAILKQFLPPFLKKPIFNSEGSNHPVADLIKKVKTKKEGKMLISMSIEQLKFVGIAPVRKAFEEALNNIDSWDDDTKSSMLVLIQFVFGKADKE